jgi:Fe2+ transport system protein FeoA
MNVDANILALSEAKPGRTYILVGFDTGQMLKEKIYSMGLNSGTGFKILLNPGHGPVELEVRRTRLGIGRGMARKIRVKEFEQ